MLTKVVALLHSKLAVAVIGAVLVGGTGTAVALAATSGHLPLTQATSESHDGATKTPDSHDNDNHAHSVSIEGVLKAYDAGGKTIGVLANGGKSPTIVAVDANTKVNGEQASSLADLSKNLGHGVEVQADKQSNGSLLAWKITVQGAEDTGNGDDNGGDAHQGQQFAFGVIASVGSGSFVVTVGNGKTRTVTVNGSTQFMGSAHSLADLKKGMHVAAVGTMQSDGSLLASRVVVAAVGLDH
jgi:hypothetical protein